MNWVSLFFLISFPLIFGVGVTISFPDCNDHKYTWMVYLFGAIWAFISFNLYFKFYQADRKNHVVKWISFTILMPFCVLLFIALFNDNDVKTVFQNNFNENLAKTSATTAPTSPSVHFAGGHQIPKILAAVQPKAISFFAKLSNALPAWCWFLALSISATWGKK